MKMKNKYTKLKAYQKMKQAPSRKNNLNMTENPPFPTKKKKKRL